MILRHKGDLEGTTSAVQTDDWSTVRFLLREDGAGLTVTDGRIREGSDAVYGYEHHQEVCYCLEGDATLEELDTGRVHRVGPGTLWLARRGERFRFVVREEIRLVSVFTPALVGPETNDEAGSFPLLGPDPQA